MVTTTVEHPVPELQTEPQARTDTPTPTAKSALEHFEEYGRERPGVVALWCFGLGFVLGWKLKLW